MLTTGCNLGCSYCFEKDILRYRRMPVKVVKGVVDLLIKYFRDEASLKITHFGGEPTLNFKAIKFVTEYAEEKALAEGKTIEFNTTTNGTLLTEEMVDYFARYKIKVLLSVDGLQANYDRFRRDKKGRGTFSRVMRGLSLLKARQPWIAVKITGAPTTAG
jgi:uncharacterized protein